MELRHLRYFLAVADAGHITRAAQTLGIQQPPLSQQLKALETELGIALFRRLPRGVELTAAGQAFHAEALDILARVDNVRARMQRMARGDEGHLAIGFTSSAAAHHFISDVLRACRKRYPNLSLKLSESHAATVIAEVASGRLHAGFVRAPVERPAGLAFDTLLQEDMRIALPLDHPLAHRAADNAPVSLRELAGDAFILVRLPGAPGMYGDLLNVCETLGFKPRIAAEVERMMSNLNLVAAGAGVSVVPASMEGTHRQGIAYCRMKEASRLRAPLTLVTRKADDDPAVAVFARLTHALAARYRVAAPQASGSRDVRR
jgi:DNA-binding transcriptional LysR family regulator